MSLFSKLFGNRKKEMRELSKALGMDFRDKDDYGMLQLLVDFKLFSRGSSKRIRHILTKKGDGHDSKISIFDYRFVVGGGNNSRVYNQTVFFVNAKDLNLPTFFMKPEGFFLKIGQYLNFKQDIDFESHPEFSDQYFLKGPVEEFVRETFDDNVLHFFTIEKDWSLEGINYYLIFYKKGHRIPVDQIEDFYEKGLYIYDMMSVK